MILSSFVPGGHTHRPTRTLTVMLHVESRPFSTHISVSHQNFITGGQSHKMRQTGIEATTDSRTYTDTDRERVIPEQ